MLSVVGDNVLHSAVLEDALHIHSERIGPRSERIEGQATVFFVYLVQLRRHHRWLKTKPSGHILENIARRSDHIYDVQADNASLWSRFPQLQGDLSSGDTTTRTIKADQDAMSRHEPSAMTI
jgi:hypothetical protein